MLILTDRKSASAVKEYFSKQERVEGRDAYSVRFLGKIAHALGIAGQGLRSVFNALVDNKTPDGEKLTPRAGENRVIGKEACFNAPKGASLIAEFAPEGHRVRDAFEASVVEAIEKVAEPAAEVRVANGRSTSNVKTGELLVSLFIHHTNRSHEPHLHAHALIHNVTTGPDGRRALKSTEIHNKGAELQKAFSEGFRKRVEDLGFRTVDRSSTLWDVAGIPKSTIRKFSSRRESVEALFEKAKAGQLKTAKGHDFPMGNHLRRVAGTMTRAPKADVVDLGQLRKEWKAKLTPREINVFKSSQVKPKVGRRLAKSKARVAYLRHMSNHQIRGRDHGQSLDR